MNKLSLKADFAALLEQYSIHPIESFDYYLVETWKDLASQSLDQAKGVNRLAFLKYYELPLVISQHLFRQFDLDKNDYLSKEEFVNGMKRLFDNKSFATLTEIVFKLYADGNETIHKEDARMIMAYIQQPKENKAEGLRNRAIDPEIRGIYHEKVDIILSETFEPQTVLLAKEAFIEAIRTKCSDLFTLLVIFLYDNRPFNNDSLKAYQDKVTPRAQISPSLKTAPIELTAPLFKNSAAMTAMLASKPKASAEHDLLKKLTSTSNETKEDVSYYFKPKVYTTRNTNNLTHIFKKVSMMNIDKDQISNPLREGGYMFKITKNKKMKIFWFKVKCRDLFYYQSRSSLTHKGMHHLSNVFLSEKGVVEYKQAKLYAFSLIFNRRTRVYYVEKEEDYQNWLSLIGRTLDQRDITHDYEITANEDSFIKGKYGLIKPAVQSITNREVMIKYIDKKTLTKQDQELVHYEMEILKFSQQRNIIRLYDIYEDDSFIYYVLEKCSGLNLFSYIEKRNYRLPEKRTCEIVHKLLMAVYYLQAYGVIHRDLKPENILMTDSSEDADIRLVGFNLGKITMKRETCREPLGTLSYVSPEILTEKPYHHAVDIWSIGIITYLLLSGSLPFDDDHSEREIARQTIHDPVSFKNSLWTNYSNEAKLFVLETLNKDQFKRIKVHTALVHPWIKKYYRLDVERRTTCASKDLFKCFTMSVEEEDL